MACALILVMIHLTKGSGYNMTCCTACEVCSSRKEGTPLGHHLLAVTKLGNNCRWLKRDAFIDSLQGVPNGPSAN